jgi:hypothetical protein
MLAGVPVHHLDPRNLVACDTGKETVAHAEVHPTRTGQEVP